MLIIALILLVVIFSVLNVDPVNINFGFTTVAIPLVIVIIGTLLIGVLIAVIWSTSIVFRERSQKKKLQQKLDDFDHEAKTKQDKLKDEHQAENNALNDQIEKRDVEIRELKRRIQNMTMSQSAKTNQKESEHDFFD